VLISSLLGGVTAAGGSGWELDLRYGSPLPATRHGEPQGAPSGYAELRPTPGGSRELVLPFDATVDVHPPSAGLLNKRKAAQLIASRDGAEPLTIYLIPKLTKVNAAWSGVVRRVAAHYLDPERLGAEGAAVDDFVEAVVLRDVDPASVRAALLSTAAAVRNNQRVQADAERRWKEFLLGRSPFVARRGAMVASPIGDAIGIGLLTAVGMADPWLLFEAAVAENAVDPADRPAVEALLVTLGRTPPAIDPAAGPDQVDGRRHLWPELMAWRAARRPSCSQWRGVLDRQKTRLLAELAVRVRPSGTGPRFVFHEHDCRSPLQIEAVTEFYLNNPDPWKLTSPLVAPDATNYRTVELSDLFGWAAQPQPGTAVELDGGPALDRVVPGRDVLELDGETVREHRQFRIMRVVGTVVELDVAPVLNGPSSWRILQDPVLVLLDAAGARVTGDAASVTGTREVTLSALDATQLAGVQRINRHYDTIGFLDAPTGSRSDFQIVDVRIVTPQGRPPDAVLTLDAAPALNGSSRWGVPAGLGGRQAPVPWPRDAQSPGKSWYDQYDGRLFVLAGDRAAAVLPWSSLTSRKQALAHLSSLAGNRHYRAISALTPKHRTTFKVVDGTALPHGGTAVAAGAQPSTAITLDSPLPLADYAKDNGWWLHLISAAPPRFRALPLSVSGQAQQDDLAQRRVHVGKGNVVNRPAAPTPYWLALYDGVRYAAQYFDADVVPDVASPGPPTATARPGKFGIRMHVGAIPGTGSQGCLVSPWFWSFRNAMTALHERRHRTFYAEHPGADLIADVNVTTDDPPPVVAGFIAASDQLTQLTGQLTRMEEIVRGASREAAGTGGDELVLVADRLSAVLADMRRRRTVDSEHGDGVEPDRLEDLLDQVSEILASDAGPALDEIQDPPLSSRLAALVHLRAEVADASERLRAEEVRVGWTSALRSELYLIRPDERPLP
jgi:hypothetical protein